MGSLGGLQENFIVTVMGRSEPWLSPHMHVEALWF